MLQNSPSIAELQTLLDTPPKREVRIQFSEAHAYNAPTLKFVNEICRQLGAAGYGCKRDAEIAALSRARDYRSVYRQVIH